MLTKSTATSDELRLALRVRDASAAIGVSRSSLCKMIASGKLPSTKVAGRRLVLLEDLHALLRAGAREA
jgi:excisionase family DNA binding protein